MKRIKSLVLSLILVLALCVGVVACTPQGPTKYTLSFDMGGHGTQIVSQSLTAEEKPTEAGWKFEGWYADSSYSVYFNFNNTLYKDVTAYAKWTEAYKVSFNTGIDGLTFPTQEIAADGRVVLPDESKMVADGKKFEGWYIDSTFTTAFDPTTHITAD